MIKTLLYLLLLVAPVALAQNECANLNPTYTPVPYALAKDTNGVVHQNLCYDGLGNIYGTANFKAAPSNDAVLLNPASSQTMQNGASQFNVFDQNALTNYSQEAQNLYNGVVTAYGGNSEFAVIANRVPTTTLFMNDRPGADGVQNTVFMYSVITNNTANRGNSTQGSAMNANSVYTGTFNFGFMNAANFNTENMGSGTLNQAIDLWAASPINQGGGSILNTVGLHVASQNLASGNQQQTARGIEFENFASTGSNARSYAIYESTPNNNLLGSGDNYMGALTLNCQPTEANGCTWTASTLPSTLGSNSILNGTIVYCTDCTVTTPGSCTNVTTAAACTCTGSGSGAFAKRVNGAWLCN